MKIMDRIRQKVQDERDDPTGAVAEALREQALAAIIGGINSPEWTAYMMNFVDAGNPAQLARMRAKDDAQNDAYMKQALAYLVANAVCGADTITRTLERVEADDMFDRGL